MSTMRADPTLVRQRLLVRADRLKRRATAFSLLGFAAFFGLASQHVVRGASTSTVQATGTVQRATPARRTAYFDQGDSSFTFADAAPLDASAGLASSAQPPVAQTSVS